MVQRSSFIEIFIQRRGGRSRGSPPTSRCSHARAFAHSRLTVIGATPSTSAISCKREPAEESELDDLGLSWVSLGQFPQRVVYRHEVTGAVGRRGLLGLRDIHDADATPVGTFCPASGQVDQDVPHQAGRHRQEVGSVLPTRRPASSAGE